MRHSHVLADIVSFMRGKKWVQTNQLSRIIKIPKTWKIHDILCDFSTSLLKF